MNYRCNGLATAADFHHSQCSYFLVNFRLAPSHTWHSSAGLAGPRDSPADGDSATIVCASRHNPLVRNPFSFLKKKKKRRLFWYCSQITSSQSLAIGLLAPSVSVDKLNSLFPGDVTAFMHKTSGNDPKIITRSWTCIFPVRISQNIFPCCRSHMNPCRESSGTWQGTTACVKWGYILIHNQSTIINNSMCWNYELQFWVLVLVLLITVWVLVSVLLATVWDSVLVLFITVWVLVVVVVVVVVVLVLVLLPMMLSISVSIINYSVSISGSIISHSLSISVIIYYSVSISVNIINYNEY